MTQLKREVLYNILTELYTCETS